MERFANNADSTLNGAIDNDDTTIVVADGSPFPSVGEFRLIFGVDADNAEIVIATARSGNTITVIRGQEGTTAQSWGDGTIVTHIVTAGAAEALRDTLKGKTLSSSLETVGASQDGYALTWVNTDGYWAARPGSQWTTANASEIYTTKTVSIDGNGTLASTHGTGSSKLFVNGSILASSFVSGEIPLSTQGFGYVSDNTQTFTVPAGVTSLKVKMWGPGGGTGNYSNSGGGGAGGFSTGLLSVTPGEQLILVVGSGGKKPASSSGNGGLGGWPGGGFGTRGDASAGGGGGYSGIFTSSISQANALIVAGGGGGSSGFGNYQAGGGGGLTGGSGISVAGKGGSQIAGGLNGNNTSSPAYTVGGMFTGGTAFTDNTTHQNTNDSGGGGSGYWGGGAGQGDGAAGGGGSGFLHATRISNGSTITGANAPSGTAAAQPASTTDPNYIAGVGIGGAAVGTVQIAGSGNNGGDGYIVFQWGGQTSFDKDSIDFPNAGSITTNDSTVTFSAPTNGNVTISGPGSTGGVTLAPGSGIITLQSAADFILSSGTSSLVCIHLEQ
jgi:hypothetical protein